MLLNSSVHFENPTLIQMHPQKLEYFQIPSEVSACRYDAWLKKKKKTQQK